MKSFVLAALAASMIVATPGVSSAQQACSSVVCPPGSGMAHVHGGQDRGQGVNHGDYRGGHYVRGNGGYYGGNGGYYDGFDAGGGVAALAAGALIGGVLASQLQQPVAGDPGYCARRYRSYDPASGTYLGYDGLRHRC